MTTLDIKNKIKQIKTQMREAESWDELANLAIRLKGWQSELAKKK